MTMHKNNNMESILKNWILYLLVSMLLALPTVTKAGEFSGVLLENMDREINDHLLIQKSLNLLEEAVIIEFGHPSNENTRIPDGEIGLNQDLQSQDHRHFVYTFNENKTHWSVQGASPLGLFSGICWLTDRIKTTGQFPNQNVSISPAFQRHFIYISPPSEDLGIPNSEQFEQVYKRTQENLIEAALYGATDILVYGRNKLVWFEDKLPEKISLLRSAYRKLIELAHNLGLRVILVGDELIYHPEWLRFMDAQLCTQDQQLWKLLGSKFANVLSALPETDGILVRTGEVIPKGEYKSFDLVHHRCEKEQRSFELIYQQIIQTVHQVVCEEFGKEYIHRTWVTSSHEQHSIEDVFQRIFTEEIPTDNLIVSIKLTRTDQWQFQQLNPTFGLSPHQTNVEIETSRFQRPGSPIIDFAAERIASGMQFALHRGAKSLSNGIATHGSIPLDAANYMIWRFSWNPDANVREITRDWATSRFGRTHAYEIADIFLSLDKAVRNAWYVRPLALRHWNPRPHVYIDRFVLKGNPIWDRGAGHDRFLYELYLQAKPWIADTQEEMTLGIRIWEEARDDFLRIAADLENQEAVNKVSHDLTRGAFVLRLNQAYMNAIFACYAYRENPSSQKLQFLKKKIEDLEHALHDHENNDGFYGTKAIHVFLSIAERIQENLTQAEVELKNAPAQDEIRNMIRETAKKDNEFLKNHPNARSVFRWSGTVDGRDILYVNEKGCHIEHLVADPASNIHQKIIPPFPTSGTYVLKRIKGRGYVYLLEAPSPENNMTAKIYIDDPLPSSDVHELELCVVPE